MATSPEQKEKEVKDLIEAWLASGKERARQREVNDGQNPRRPSSSAQSGPSGLGLGGGK
jgi:hypothetical protein